jgi:hypothetical protein
MSTTRDEDAIITAYELAVARLKRLPTEAHRAVKAAAAKAMRDAGMRPSAIKGVPGAAGDTFAYVRELRLDREAGHCRCGACAQ